MIDKINQIKLSRLPLVDKMFLEVIEDLGVIEHNGILYYMKECIIYMEYCKRNNNIKVDHRNVWVKFQKQCTTNLDTYDLMKNLIIKYLIKDNPNLFAYSTVSERDSSTIPYETKN